MAGAAVAPLFLHSEYDPGISVALQTADVKVALSDIAVLAVVVAALLVGKRQGFAPLRAGGPVWIAGGAFVLLVMAGAIYPLAFAPEYPFATNIVSAAKFVEYALLAPAVALIVRRPVDAVALVAGVTLWTAAASLYGVLQFLGLIDDFDLTPPGRRKPSFVGYHYFAILAGAALAAGFVRLALPDRTRLWRSFAAIGTTAGVVGLILAGAVASVAGIVAGAGLATRRAAREGGRPARRIAGIVALALVVTAGTGLMRTADLSKAFGDDGPDRGIETYSHRTVLTYLGIRIFLDHPLLGVGWQGSLIQENVEPYLDDARARYPSIRPEALPSPAHPWGVQNGYVQAASDLGIGGLAALLALFAAGVFIAWRASLAADAWSPVGLLALLWLVLVGVEWAAVGLLAGVPINALLWLSLGLAVASRRAEQSP